MNFFLPAAIYTLGSGGGLGYPARGKSTPWLWWVGRPKCLETRQINPLGTHI